MQGCRGRAWHASLTRALPRCTGLMELEKECINEKNPPQAVQALQLKDAGVKALSWSPPVFCARACVCVCVRACVRTKLV